MKLPKMGKERTSRVFLHLQTEEPRFRGALLLSSFLGEKRIRLEGWTGASEEQQVLQGRRRKEAAFRVPASPLTPCPCH